MSPELVLVDPALAARARLDLADLVEPPTARPSEPTSPPAPGTPFLDSDADAALRRLAQTAAEATPPPAARPRRRWKLLFLAPALVATIVLAASAQLRGESAVQAPPAGETTAPVASAEPRGMSPRLAWTPSAEVGAYDVEIFRNSDRIFATRTTVPRIDVPPNWSYAGRELALDPGEYHWYVWPVVDGERGSSTMVGSTFTVQAP